MTTTHLRSILPAAVLALAGALPACAPDFDPASEISGFRVLAVRAEPPELAHGSDAAPARAALDALVVDPAFLQDPAASATVLYLACTPRAGDPASAAACTSLSALDDAAALVGLLDPVAACAAPGRGAPGALTFAGVAACGAAGCGPVTVRLDPSDPASAVELPPPAYELPGDLGLGALPAGAPERTLGVEVVTLALALDAAPAALAPAAPVADACEALAALGARFVEEWDAHERVPTVKRLRVRGPDATDAPNVNPPIAALELDGTVLAAPGGAPTPVAAGRDADLLPVFPGEPLELMQRYTRRDAAGLAIEEKVETWAFSWFATAGELERLRTNEPDEVATFEAPAEGRARIWAVVRDLRGGTSWTAAEVEAR